MNHFLSAYSRAIIALHFKDFFQLFLFSKFCTRPLFLFSGDIAETQRFALETMRRVVAMVSKCFSKSEKKSFEVEIGQTIRDQMMSILPWILKPFNIFVSAVCIRDCLHHLQKPASNQLTPKNKDRLSPKGCHGRRAEKTKQLGLTETINNTKNQILP